MSDRFDYDEIVGPPPEKDVPRLFVLYRYTSSGLKTYKAKRGLAWSLTTLKSQASVCNAAGALALAIEGEWYIELHES
jgi:hypothetical protein